MSGTGPGASRTPECQHKWMSKWVNEQCSGGRKGARSWLVALPRHPHPVCCPNACGAPCSPKGSGGVTPRARSTQSFIRSAFNKHPLSTYYVPGCCRCWGMAVTKAHKFLFVKLMLELGDTGGLGEGWSAQASLQQALFPFRPQSSCPLNGSSGLTWGGWCSDLNCCRHH